MREANAALEKEKATLAAKVERNENSLSHMSDSKEVHSDKKDDHSVREELLKK